MNGDLRPSTIAANVAKTHRPRAKPDHGASFALLSGGSLRRAVGRDQQCATNHTRPRSEERFRGRAAAFVRFLGNGRYNRHTANTRLKVLRVAEEAIDKVLVAVGSANGAS